MATVLTEPTSQDRPTLCQHIAMSYEEEHEPTQHAKPCSHGLSMCWQRCITSSASSEQSLQDEPAMSRTIQGNQDKDSTMLMKKRIKTLPICRLNTHLSYLKCGEVPERELNKKIKYTCDKAKCGRWKGWKTTAEDQLPPPYHH